MTKLYLAYAWALDENDEEITVPQLRVILSQYLEPEEYFLDSEPNHKTCLVFLKTAEAAEKVNAVGDSVFRHPAEEMSMRQIIDHLECTTENYAGKLSR